MMSWLRKIWLFVRRDRVTRELEEEMELHRELRAEQLDASGSTSQTPRHAAARRFGNATLAVERSRDEWGLGSFDDLMQDIRYAARRLRLRPGFTISVTSVLALGIGATTSMFSAIDAAVLRPLPFVRPDELITLRSINIPHAFPRQASAEPAPTFDIRDVANMPSVIASVAAYAVGGLNLSDQQSPRRLTAGVVSADFFRVLGANPEKGRTFTAEDASATSENVVVLSWGMWQQQYGGADVIGLSIPLSGKSYRVIGVMKRGFGFPEQSDIWIPMSVPTTPATFAPFRGWLPSRVIARMAPGVTLETANAQLEARWAQYVSQFKVEPGRRLSVQDSYDEVKRLGAVTPLRTELVGDRKRALFVLFGATVMLLLIACGNVTNLLLSHGAARARELSVRTVLGATRARVVRQLLAESVLLSVAGAAAGVVLAPVFLLVLRALMPAALAGVSPAQIDVRVLAFATGMGLVTGVLFGLWPAFGATRLSVATAVKSGGGHGATAFSTRRVQRFLVAGEVALTVMLLVGSGLMLRSFSRLVHTDSGFSAERTGTLELSFARGQGPGVVQAKAQSILDRVSAIPGVTAAGIVNDLPLRGDGGIAISVEVDGMPPEAKKDPFARYLIASENYFTAMGIPLLSGRFFTPGDDANAKVAIINAAMAKLFWKDQNPVGRTFIWGGDTMPITVVGIVADVRESGLDSKAPAQMYFPLRGTTALNVAVVARGALPAKTLLHEMSAAIRTIDPTQAVYRVRMMDDVVGASVASRRANTLLISLFAFVALLVSALGVYAVTANAVVQRMREFGIRSALGATGRDLLRHVGGEMTWVAVGGVATGAMLSWWLSHVMQSLLYEIQVHDVQTFAAVPLVLVAAVVVATLIPARKAVRVNPVEVMKAE